MTKPQPMRRLISKIVAVLILSSTTAWKFHSDRNERVTMGRVAFLAKQEAFYDRYYQRVRPWPVDYVEIAIGCGVFIAVYELFSFGIFKAVKASENRPQQ
jgi:hypothetical protein